MRSQRAIQQRRLARSVDGRAELRRSYRTALHPCSVQRFARITSVGPRSLQEHTDDRSPGAQSLRRVELATGRSVHNAKDWLERLDEGQKRSIYMSIFAKKTSWAPLADRSTAAPGRLPVEVKAGNVEVVHDLLAQNRNVILLCLHGIPYRPILPVQHYLDSRGLQATTIARSATRLENGDCNVVASAEDMPYQLVRLCKALRNGQQPRLIEIYPDGAYGQSFATMDIGGQTYLWA